MKLTDCPKCGTKPSLMVDDDQFTVSCKRCGRSKSAPSAEKLIEKWSTRGYQKILNIVT